MKQIDVSDLSISELHVYAELSERQLSTIYEPKPGLFIAESPKVIRRAIDAGYCPVSFLVEKGELANVREVRELLDDLEKRYGAERKVPDRAEGEMPDRSVGESRAEGESCAAGYDGIGGMADIKLYTAEETVLSKLTGFHLTRGMLCAMERKPLPKAEDILKDAKRIAILEEVENPTNVGAIFRSAAALGMDGILLTGGCADPLYRRAIRVSMGTVFQIPWTVLPKKEGIWPEQTMTILRAAGFQTAAMALSDASIPLGDARLAKTEKLAVVLGTEGEGLKDGTIASCDFTVRIPMSHGVDSLNVAAASAVAFWELGQRGDKSWDNS